MNRFLFVIALVLLVACKKEQTPNAQTISGGIIGKWTRIETYVNIGNGGNWIQTNDAPLVALEFTPEGKLLSNHSFYSNYTSFRTIGPDAIEVADMAGNKRQNSYKIENGTLTILYTCREGCGDRFIRQ